MEQACALFKEHDPGGTGSLGVREFSRVLLKLGVDENDILETIRAVDTNKDNRIDYQEFFTWLEQTSSSSRARACITIEIVNAVRK